MTARRKAPAATCLFVDVGGVLLSDGWDLAARRRAAQAFKLDRKVLEERHHLASGAYEEGRLTLDFYLDRVVFHEKRAFTRRQFRGFMFRQSKPIPGMLELVGALKARHRLKVAVVSNEGRELNDYRIRTFKLDALADFFITSCFVGLRKPDPAIYRLALDLAQTAPPQVLYLENTPMFAQVAQDQGIPSIVHSGLESTRAALAACGLDDGRPRHAFKT